MSTSHQATTEPEALTIFDDVHEVPAEPAAFVGMQLAAIILTYSVLLGLAVVVVVIVVLAITLFWPILLAALSPGVATVAVAFS